MKKLSILCTFMFVIGMMASSAFAQCDSDVDCAENEICNPDDICVSVDPTVSVDIKPGSCPNPLNVRSRGVLPVAILGTDEFDVRNIDPETILITREGFDGILAIRHSYEDVGIPFEGELCDCDDLNENDLNEDGYMDLILKFRVPELVDGLGLKEVESREIIPLTIMGNSVDGTIIMGEDCIRVINWMQRLQDKLKNPKKPKNQDE